MRLTASNRPGVAQPVPERDIPDRRWGAIMAGALVLFLALMTAWELGWRAYGAVPSYRNSDGEWALQRRRIDEGEGGKTVLIGSSRVLFDLDLATWERVTGERPIQLALEGTSPLPVLEDLAADPSFTGRLLVGVAPDLFFSGFAYRAGAVKYFHDESPADRAGTQLSRTLVEPYFAYYDADFALAKVIRRLPWPERVHQRLPVRKLMVQDADRSSRMWDKVASDPEYREIARATWAQDFDEPLPGMATPEAMRAAVDEQVGKAVAAVQKLRARGVRVVFVRMPSGGPYLAYEDKHLPRDQTWDVLLARTGAPGIHFADHPEMQGYELPEWSHMSAAEAARFTAVFAPLAARTFGAM